MHDVSFTGMGCEMRLLAAGVGRGAIAEARDLLGAIDARLSRFRADSELTRLNADPRATVPASPLLRAAVGAALWAAERTDGLVDPTLLDDLERHGYVRSMAGCQRADLTAALALAPPRRAAAPRPDRRWRAVRVDGAAGTVTRPPGLRLDTGGTTKGLAADAAARVLGGAERLVVDCGGDLRVAVAPGAAPFDIALEHPLTGACAAMLRIRGGGVATSGLARRLWSAGDERAAHHLLDPSTGISAAGEGRAAHHLLDPATGEPAWTGLLSATALGATALEAEALAKAALLRGPAGARRLLGRHGGVLVHDDGRVERLGAAAPRPVVRLGSLIQRVAA